MSYCDCDWCSPSFYGAHNFRIVLMWSNENGIKNRMDFPVKSFSYEGNRYKVFPTTYEVMYNLRIRIHLLNNQNTQYGLYLSYEDHYNKTSNVPMKIVEFSKHVYCSRTNLISSNDYFVIMEVHMDQFTKFVAELFYEMTKDISVYYGGESFQMPRIDQIWYNDPYTTIKWSDDTTTTSKCSKDETYSKEVGVAMCISKKYLECRGFAYPRTGFKSIVDDGVDLKELHDKRNRKKVFRRATNMKKSGYPIDEIKNVLGMSDEDVAEWNKN